MSDELPPPPDPLPEAPLPDMQPEAPPPPPVLRYVVANAAGEIVRIVHCTADQAAAQAQPGECIAQHDDASSATHWLQDGQTVQAVAYSAAQLAAKAPRPHACASWDNATMAWVDPRTLDQHRADKWAAIKEAREAAKVAPTLATPYGTFDADAEALENVKGALLGRREAERLLGEPLPPVTWTLADDSGAELTTDQLAQVGVLLLSRGDAAHQTARALRAAIEAAGTVAEVEAVSWPQA